MNFTNPKSKKEMKKEGRKEGRKVENEVSIDCIKEVLVVEKKEKLFFIDYTFLPNPLK